tara:strand:- start:1051 stop:1395 length:345 start_codon:yes stop_codon:yes gene_type:complete
MKQKRSVEPGKRIEGELPEAPSTAVEIPNWWNEASSVLDRVRGAANDQIEKTNAQFNASNIKKLYEQNEDTNTFNDYYKNRLENLEEALGIDGEVMGTGNKQEMDNKFIGGGSF